MGDAYSGCLERCPEGGYEKGQHLRDEVCSASNGQQNKSGEHRHEDEQGGKQDPGHHVAGIIYDKVPQAQGNMGDYAGGDYAGGGQGKAQGGAHGGDQGAQGGAQEGTKGDVKEGHADGHKEHSQGHAQEGTQSQPSAAPSQASSASSSSQTFLTPTQTNTKTHSSTSSTTSSTSPTSTGFENDTSSAGTNNQISWAVVLASSAALYFLS